MTKQIDKIMEQAQVFASAWSLVGGRFDNGNAMDDAEVAKNELRQMVAEALAEQPAQQEPVAFIKGRGWRNGNLEVIPAKMNQTFEIEQPLYTSPPAQRKPLTDEEIDELSRTVVKGDKSVNWLCRAIEAAHGIKENT